MCIPGGIRTYRDCPNSALNVHIRIGTDSSLQYRMFANTSWVFLWLQRLLNHPSDSKIGTLQSRAMAQLQWIDSIRRISCCILWIPLELSVAWMLSRVTGWIWWPSNYVWVDERASGFSWKSPPEYAHHESKCRIYSDRDIGILTSGKNEKEISANIARRW